MKAEPKPMQARNRQEPGPVKTGLGPAGPGNLQESWPAKVKTEPVKTKTEPVKVDNAPPPARNQQKPGRVKAGTSLAQARNQQKPWPVKTRTHEEPGPVKTRNHENPGPVKAGKGPVGPGNRTRGGPGGRPPDGVAVHGAGCQRQPSSTSRLVGEEGFEPSRPCGHTDLNRARLPFRHPPRATSQVSTTSCLPPPPIRSDASRGRRYPGGSATALRAKARRHG